MTELKRSTTIMSGARTPKAPLVRTRTFLFDKSNGSVAAGSTAADSTENKDNNKEKGAWSGAG